MQIGGPTASVDFDQFAITGLAALDGTLNVSLINGYQPSLGESFQVLTFTSRSGEFATVNGNGQSYMVNYSDSDVTLVAE